MVYELAYRVLLSSTLRTKVRLASEVFARFWVNEVYAAPMVSIYSLLVDWIIKSLGMMIYTLKILKKGWLFIRQLIGGYLNLSS